jgi:hypothetical protein
MTPGEAHRRCQEALDDNDDVSVANPHALRIWSSCETVAATPVFRDGVLRSRRPVRSSLRDEISAHISLRRK